MLILLIILASCIWATVCLAAAWYLPGIVTRWWCDRRLQGATQGRGILALTYDDGPGSRTTPELLDLLAELEAKATFFLIGSPAERHPDIVHRLIDEGHTIGWHTQSHRNQWKTGPLRSLADLRVPPRVDEITRGELALFRPPYGKLTLGTIATCVLRRWRIISWTHVSGDTHQNLPEIDAVVQRVDRAGGGVVLMHDMDRHDPARPDFVLATTRALVENAKRRGWKIAHSTNDWQRIA